MNDLRSEKSRHSVRERTVSEATICSGQRLRWALWTTYTVGRRVDLDDFEVDRPHTSTDLEDVALADGSVGLEEVGSEVHVEKVARKA